MAFVVPALAAIGGGSAVAGGLLVATTAVAATGAIIQSQAARAQAKYATGIAERNAVVARDQAAADEAAHRRMVQRQLGSMRAQYGAAGVTPEGTPLDMLASSAAEGELDALNIRYEGELRAMGYEEEAQTQRMRRTAAGREGIFRAGTALLQGANTAYGNMK